MRHLPAVYRLGSKASLKCATYRRYTDLSVMGVRVGVDQSIGIDKSNTFQVGVTNFFLDQCAAYKATEYKSEIPILYL